MNKDGVKKIQRDKERERENKKEVELYSSADRYKKDWMEGGKMGDRENWEVIEWKVQKKKSKRQKESDNVWDREKGRVTAKWIYVCVFMNTPLKSKYMTALMGYWSSHRTWWMELK